MSTHCVAPMRADELLRHIETEERLCLRDYPHYGQAIRTSIAMIRSALEHHCGGSIRPGAMQATAKLAQKLGTTAEELWGIDEYAEVDELAVWESIMHPLLMIRRRCERGMFAVDTDRPLPPYLQDIAWQQFKLQ